MADTKVPPTQIVIPIEVAVKDNPRKGVRRGTFTAPWPRTVARVGDVVRWQAGKGQGFVLKFIAYGGTEARSPFGKMRVTDKDDFLRVINAGDFHYQVSVSDPGSGEKFEICHCPEFGVGN